jgi:IS66 Orf2 like protein
MIAFPSSVRVWLAAGRTDMRREMNGLALQVQQSLGRDPHAGGLYVFRGARGELIKVLWHNGVALRQETGEEPLHPSYGLCQAFERALPAADAGAKCLVNTTRTGEDPGKKRRSLRLLCGGWLPHDDGASEGCLALATDVSASTCPK